MDGRTDGDQDRGHRLLHQPLCTLHGLTEGHKQIKRPKLGAPKWITTAGSPAGPSLTPALVVLSFPSSGPSSTSGVFPEPCGHSSYPPWAQPHQLLPQRQIPHPTLEQRPAKPPSLSEPVAGRVLQDASVSKAGQQIPPALGFVLLWAEKGAFVISAWSSVLLPYPSGWLCTESGAPIPLQRPLNLPTACLPQPGQAQLALTGFTALGLSSWKTLCCVTTCLHLHPCAVHRLMIEG